MGFILKGEFVDMFRSGQSDDWSDIEIHDRKSHDRLILTFTISCIKLINWNLLIMNGRLKFPIERAYILKRHFKL